MKTFYTFIAIVLLSAGAGTMFYSCSNNEFSDFQTTASGLKYKFHVKGTDTVHPKYGEIVRVKMTKRFGDSTLESSESILPDGLRQLLRKPLFKGAVEEGIILMAMGDSATFLVSTDSINKYYPDSVSAFKPNSYLAYNIKLVNIQTKEEVMWERENNKRAFINDRKELGPKELSQYIADNHIEVKPTPSGLYFIEIEKGKGIMPKNGDSVTVHFAGSFLNGTIFSSSLKKNQPFTFMMGDTSKYGVIPGWMEGIKKMKKGGKATFIITPSLAYDSIGRMDRSSNKYVIPPYTNLKFDIQLLDIHHKK